MVNTVGADTLQDVFRGGDVEFLIENQIRGLHDSREMECQQHDDQENNAAMFPSTQSDQQQFNFIHTLNWKHTPREVKNLSQIILSKQVLVKYCQPSHVLSKALTVAMSAT